MPFMRLTEKQKNALGLEVVPQEARLELTRIIRDACDAGDETDIALIRENEFINIANQILGNAIYVLNGGDLGEYYPAEYAWHHGERELIMRVPSTPQLAEILADYLQKEMLSTKRVNDVLNRYGCGFSFERVDALASNKTTIKVNVLAVESIEEVDLNSDHPNVRRLVARMDRALADKDFAGVLHTSASIFETLAKDVMESPNVNNQTLASFFDGYRKKSLLPEPVLDYMLLVYKERNIVPLAGHGSLTAPSISAEEAVTLSELTKTIVRIERKLSEQAIAPKSGKA
jgi:hypothetical protein